MQEQLCSLSTRLVGELTSKAIANDPIHFCGPAPLKLIKFNPDAILELARLQLHASPFSKVPMCWRRLYEEATLYKTASLLYAVSTAAIQSDSGRASQFEGEPDDWLAKIVTALDMSLITVGAPGRREVFEWLFQRLAELAPPACQIQTTFAVIAPHGSLLKSLRGVGIAIPRASHPLDMDEFQQHLHPNGAPLIIPGTMTHWPAMERWKDPNYFMRLTIGGRRIVPVEIGSSYTDADWTQTTMSFREWCFAHLLDEKQKKKGYLAQHDLFEQIPALRQDIAVPDYCYTAPSEPQGAAALTFGLSSVPALDEPIVNAWIGPKGTKTPLHTDAYHNILCQVIGYKYVRLYAPEQTPDLHPVGIDDKGIDMSNTASTSLADLESRNVPHVEGILAPGECLYIPLGWWHYVESLSVSASVSFWWN